MTSDVIRVTCGVILGIAIICFALNQWLYGIYALITDAIVMRLDLR